MFCPKCGNQLNEGAAFCPKCGTKIVNPEGNTANQQTIPRQSIPGNNTVKNSRNNMITIFVIGGVAVFVLLIIAVISSSNSSAPASSPSVAAPAAEPTTNDNSIVLTGDAKTGNVHYDPSVLSEAGEILNDFANKANEITAASSDHWYFAWWCESTSSVPIFYILIKPADNMTSSKKVVNALKQDYGLDELFVGNEIDMMFIFVDKADQFMAAYDEDGNEISKPSNFDSLVEMAFEDTFQ